MTPLVKAICPNFPDDRDIKETMDKERWYRSVGNVLYVPREHYLRSSPREIDRYCEAVMGFAEADLEQLALGAARWKIPFNVFSTDEDCAAYLERLTSECPGFITCDIECSHTGWDNQNMLAIGFKHDEDIVGIITAFGPKTVAALNSLFKSSHKFVWHNGKFDIGRLRYILNVTARVDEDTMLLHYVGINEKKGTHGLKDLAPLYLQAPQWDDELDEYKKRRARALGIKLKDFRYDDIPLNILLPYLAMDVTATWELNKLFHKIARPGAMRAYRNLIAASNVYSYVETAGCLVDQEYLNALHIELQEACDDAEDVVDAAAKKLWDPMQYSKETGAKYPGQHFNHKSPAQLKWLLTKITGTAPESTDADALKELYKEYPNHEFLRALCNLRKLNKQLDTYVTGIRTAMCKDGRVRATFNLHGTETGRLSCSNPNMQNIPRDKKIKNIFKAAPGKIFVQLDYSQAELRALAYLAQDPWLIKVYVDGRDLHDSVATEMFGPNFTKEQRVMAKTINFGIAYGRGPGSLCDVFGISMTEATDIIRRWFEPQPQTKKWIAETRMKPQRGQECLSPFGRMRHFTITNTNIYNVQNESINFPVSSTATDLTMLSLIEIYNLIQGSQYAGRIHIINTVHDSIIAECDDDVEVVKWMAATGKEVMRTQPIKQLKDCNVPFRADVEVGYSWGKLHDYDEWLEEKEGVANV